MTQPEESIESLDGILPPPPFLTEYFANLHGHYAEKLNAFMTSLWSKIVSSLKSSILNRGKTPAILRTLNSAAGLELIIPSFCACNIVLAPSMSRRLWWDIVRTLPPDKEKVNKRVTNYYEGKRWSILKSMVHNWMAIETYRQREKILKDALQAHLDEKWTLSIPALLPQIDGISLNVIMRHQLPVKKASVIIDKSISKEAGRTLPSQLFISLDMDRFTPLEMVSIYTLLYYLESQLYRRTDFAQHADEANQSSFLNRHSVLHGVQVDYASKLNSLMCFLVLDILSLASKSVEGPD